MKKSYLLSIVCILLSCNQKEKSSDSPQSFYSTSTDQNGIAWDVNESYMLEDEIADGTYCAEVEYYNPNTGTRNTYELDVEVENGYLVQINWPNGGWLDETHFISEEITSGECSFISDRGYRYTVVLGEKGGNCYNEGFQLQNQVNDDTENTTCPRCGNEKNEYEDYCDDCNEEILQEEENEDINIKWFQFLIDTKPTTTHRVAVWHNNLYQNIFNPQKNMISRLILFGNIIYLIMK